MPRASSIKPAGLRTALLLLSFRPAAGTCLNEIMANPAGSEYTDEYVEVLNADSVAADLQGWSLSDGTGTDALIPWGGGDLRLAPGGLALILDPGHAGEYLDAANAGVLILTVADDALGSAGLSNSTVEEIRLLDSQGQSVDGVSTRPELAEGFSLERSGPGSFCGDCWAPSRRPGGSPGQPNTVLPRDQELTPLLTAAGLRVRATGRLGFRGDLRAELGREPCLRETFWPGLDLAAGDSLDLALPAPPLALSNPVRVYSRIPAEEGQLILDTLLAAPSFARSPYIEVVQPDGEDWVQVASPDTCPCLLDGLALEARAFRADLSGWLPPAGRLVVGRVPPACPQALHLERSLTLARAGSLILLGQAGQGLDQAVWPGSGRDPAAPWRRLDPAAPGDDPDSWVEDAGVRPGCASPSLPVPPPGLSGWWVGPTALRDGDPQGCLLVAECLFDAADWCLEVWTLEGILAARACTMQRRQVINLCAAPRLDAGLYLLRLSGADRELLRPITMQRE